MRHRALVGRYRVAVQDHAVSGVSRIDGKTAAGEEEIEVPTLAGLLELAQTAVDDGADATTTFDTADGHPIQVSINRAEEATGGADCFIVSEYTPRRMRPAHSVRRAVDDPDPGRPAGRDQRAPARAMASPPRVSRTSSGQS